MVVSGGLADPSQGKRVSVREGQPITSDGPFAEAKEYLAGLHHDRVREHGPRC